MKKQTKSFKAEMNLPKLIQQFGNDEQCRLGLPSFGGLKALLVRAANRKAFPRCWIATNMIATLAVISFR